MQQRWSYIREEDGHAAEIVIREEDGHASPARWRTYVRSHRLYSAGDCSARDAAMFVSRWARPAAPPPAPPPARAAMTAGRLCAAEAPPALCCSCASSPVHPACTPVQNAAVTSKSAEIPTIFMWPAAYTGQLHTNPPTKKIG